MFRFPYFGYPYNNPYYRYYPKYNNYINNNSNTQPLSTKISSTTRENVSSNTATESRKINSSTINSEQALFEIFGIKLFFDDIVILCLLFFLYQENVNDEMLYIILFMLLFS